MKQRFIFYCLSLLLCSLSFSVVQAQQNAKDSIQIQILTTKRGDILAGHILVAKDSSLTFLFKQDTLFFDFDDIVKIEFIDSEDALDTFYDNQNRTKLGLTIKPRPDMQGHEYALISPTAFNLKRKEGEYRNLMLAANSVDFGISDNASFGVGVVLPIFLYLNTKFSFEANKNLHFGIGNYLFVSTLQFNNEIPTFDYLYGVLTIGNPEAFFNLSGGYYIPFDQLDESRFLITFGGGVRLGKSWRMNGELMRVLNEDIDSGGLLSTLTAGWFNQHDRIDFGVFIVPTGFETIPIPIISYTRRFR